VALLFLLVWMLGDPLALAEQMAALSLSALVVALALITLNRFLMAYKWIRLLVLRGHTLGIIRGVKIYCSSMVWGLFLPSTMGADAIRTACTVREGLPAREVIASIAIERMIGLIATPLLAIGSLMLLRGLGELDPALEPVWWASLGLLAAGLAAFLISLDRRFYELLHGRILGRFQDLRVFRLLESSHQTFRAYRSSRRELSIFFLLTILENVFPIVVTWVIGRGLGAPIDLLHLAGAVPLAYLVSRIPFSIAGIGVYEGVFVLILSATGVAVEQSLSMALLARILQIVAWLPWWLAYSLEGGRPDPT
jgi:uncharacterized protein (TIRG00374 family)